MTISDMTWSLIILCTFFSILGSVQDIPPQEFTIENNKLYTYQNGQSRQYLIPDLRKSDTLDHVSHQDPYIILSTKEDHLLIWDADQYQLKRITFDKKITQITFDAWRNTIVHFENDSSIISDTQIPNPLPLVTIDQLYMIDKNGSHPTQDSIWSENEGIKIKYSSHCNKCLGKLTYWYQIKSENGNNSWTNNSDENQVVLSNLKAGKYTFRVKSTMDEKYFSKVVEQSIMIKKPWYNNPIYALLIGLLIATFVIYLSYKRQLKTRNETNARIASIKLKNELIQSKQQALLLQMNPHFLFNVLNAIQGYIALEDNQKARKYLQKFARMMRSMLEQNRNEFHTILQEIDYLTDYMEMENLIRNHDFEFNIEHKNIDIGQEIPSMLLQPILENAILHGVDKIDKKGKINIRFFTQDQQVHCSITDNGPGLQTDSKPKSPHQSVAISIVKERLNNYLRFHKKPLYKHENVEDQQGNILGSMVVVVLPTSFGQ